MTLKEITTAVQTNLNSELTIDRLEKAMQAVNKMRLVETCNSLILFTNKGTDQMFKKLYGEDYHKLFFKVDVKLYRKKLFAVDKDSINLEIRSKLINAAYSAYYSNTSAEYKIIPVAGTFRF